MKVSNSSLWVAVGVLVLASLFLCVGLYHCLHPSMRLPLVEGMDGSGTDEDADADAVADPTSADMSMATATMTTTDSNTDNYNHYTGLATSTVYHGPHGSTAKVIEQNGNYAIVVTDMNGHISGIYTVTSDPTNGPLNPPPSPPPGPPPGPPAPPSSSTKYYGPNGNTATVNSDAQTVTVKTTSGETIVFTTNPPLTYNTNLINDPTGTPSPPPSTSSSSTTAYASWYAPPPPPSPSPSPSPYYPSPSPPPPPPPPSPSPSPSPSPYSSSLPPGIPASQIPPGQEDLYILKSEVVPPVCPACPSSAACPRQEPCPPCPACARCPEPNFECKKVPNYNAIDNEFLPMPMLNDFSAF